MSYFAAVLLNYSTYTVRISTHMFGYERKTILSLYTLFLMSVYYMKKIPFR